MILESAERFAAKAERRPPPPM